MPFIPRQLTKRPFSLQEAMSLGMSKSSLTRMVKSDVLLRVSRGIYQASDTEEGTPDSIYRVATLRCGSPSAICLLSALEHYQLTDAISRQVWVLVPAHKRVSSLDIKLIRSRKPQWDIGIHKTKQYWITTLERTLVESVLYKRSMGHHIGLEALKQALAQKRVKLGDVADMAKRMGVAHRIVQYIEALAT